MIHIQFFVGAGMSGDLTPGVREVVRQGEVSNVM